MTDILPCNLFNHKYVSEVEERKDTEEGDHQGSVDTWINALRWVIFVIRISGVFTEINTDTYDQKGL